MRAPVIRGVRAPFAGRTVSRAVAVAALLALTGAGAGAGCNSGSGAPAAPGPEAGPVCPTTPADAIGAPCSTAGLRCSPEYACGIATVTLLCVCTDGAFRCTDSTGTKITDPPSCPAASEGGSCARTEALASGAACSEQGLLCSYPSVCAERYDSCQCSAGPMIDGGYGLRFECTQPCTSSEAGGVVVDAGTPGSDADASSDAPLPDASSPADGDRAMDGAAGDGSFALDGTAESAPADAPPPDGTVDAPVVLEAAPE